MKSLAYRSSPFQSEPGLAIAAPLGLLPSLGCAILVGGCTHDRRALVPPHASRDSAGIQIVENPAPRWKAGQGWTVDTVAMARFDDSSTGLALSSNGAIMALIDASVAMVELSGDSKAVTKVFGNDGHLRTTIARPGQGPGEFAPSPICVGAD